ncbi:MAG: class I SAM-dependent methyltransferase [Candidatus Tectomicrobia bacterium]|uniref:Class I SAM-dependent methyltransferase n=1 Tax=Tectimicrobiota bacterium TaxID=2528274 RepID=A0A932GRQ2_UNCTE|nr:class I SAM-dependent methyltransferase [Candidatus Tectomicrobia bacterium]
MSVFDLLEGVYRKLRGAGPPSHGAKLLAEFGTEKSAGPLLDLGSGSGDQSVLLAGEGRKNIHLVDANGSVLRRAHRHPALHRTIARAEALPFKSLSFQGIFLIDVFHHVSDQEAALREIFRTLTPAGVVLIVEYHRSNPIIRIFFILSLLRRKRCSFLFPSELLALARRCGLQGAIMDSDGLRFTARLQKT